MTEVQERLKQLNSIENALKLEQHRRLTELEHNLKMEKCRRHFGHFIKHVRPDFKFAWHNKLLINKLNRFAHGKIKRLMIFLPPRHSKSELCSRLLPAYMHGLHPEKHTIAASYSSYLAKKMSRDVQRIMDSMAYSEVFPDTRLVPYKKKQHDDLVTDTYVRTSEYFDIVGLGGSYRAAGVGQGITGTSAHTLIADDLIKGMQQATSPTIKEKTEEWYNSEAYTRLFEDGQVLIVQTRWAEDDLAGRLLNKDKNPENDLEGDETSEHWEVISLPALSTDFPEDYDIREEEGIPLWPEKFSVQNLRRTKRTVGSKIWSALYQQEPAPLEGTAIELEWFQRWKELPEMDFIFGSWDFTFKDTKKADFVVGQIWGVKGVRRYLIKQYRKKASFTSTLQMILLSLREYPKQREIVVEEKANGAAIIDTLKSKIGIIIPYTPTESKEARAAAVAPTIEAGNVFIPDEVFHSNMEWVIDYLNEWRHFPNGKNDDQVDATTQALLRVGNSFGGWLAATEEALIESEEGTVSEEMMELFGFNVPNRGGLGLDF